MKVNQEDVDEAAKRILTLRANPNDTQCIILYGSSKWGVWEEDLNILATAYLEEHYPEKTRKN